MTRSLAEHAHLKSVTNQDFGGIGDDAKKNGGFSAYADKIQIGNLEFQDCSVSIVENNRLNGDDGLIGMDVFSSFLVTLNFPARKLALAPLPPRPDEAAAAPALGTGDSTDSGDSLKAAPPPPADSGSDGASNAGSSTPAGQTVPAQRPHNPPRGPYDRYIAPDMKDYTPVYRAGHLLLLPASLNKSKLRLFILDTGASLTSITPAAAREVTKVHAGSPLYIRGISGKVDKVYTADEITFYFAKISQTIYDVPAFDSATVSKNAGVEVSGLLGARTLDLTTIHIDYRDGLVKFDYDLKAVPKFH